MLSLGILNIWGGRLYIHILDMPLYMVSYFLSNVSYNEPTVLGTEMNRFTFKKHSYHTFEALLAQHLLTPVQHQWLVPQQTGGVAAQPSSTPQQKGPNTVNLRGTVPSLSTLRSENSPNPKF